MLQWFTQNPEIVEFIYSIQFREKYLAKNSIVEAVHWNDPTVPLSHRCWLLYFDKFLGIQKCITFEKTQTEQAPSIQ